MLKVFSFFGFLGILALAVFAFLGVSGVERGVSGVERFLNPPIDEGVVLRASGFILGGRDGFGSSDGSKKTRNATVRGCTVSYEFWDGDRARWRKNKFNWNWINLEKVEVRRYYHYPEIYVSFDDKDTDQFHDLLDVGSKMNVPGHRMWAAIRDLRSECSYKPKTNPAVIEQRKREVERLKERAKKGKAGY